LQPLKIKQQKFIDVPLLDMNTFVMYELNSTGLSTLMSGDKALRYKDRYVVNKIDFTDSSRKFISNLKADLGIYKDNVIDLKGNVTLLREDGLSLNSELITYNRKSLIAKTDKKYTALMEENKMQGDSIIYDIKNKKIKSKNVTIIYDLQERQ